MVIGEVTLFDDHGSAEKIRILNSEYSSYNLRISFNDQAGHMVGNRFTNSTLLKMSRVYRRDVCASVCLFNGDSAHAFVAIEVFKGTDSKLKDVNFAEVEEKLD